MQKKDICMQIFLRRKFLYKVCKNPEYKKLKFVRIKNYCIIIDSYYINKNIFFLCIE